MKLSPLSFFLCLLLLIGSISCTSYKKVPYLQTGEKGEEVRILSLSKEQTVRFQPDDVLSIVINVTGESSVASIYNLPLQPIGTTYDINENTNLNAGVGRQTYLVNKAGQIDFPVLGMITVADYTQEELSQYLKGSLRRYLKEDPIITIRLLNFKISVLGEVNRPGSYTVNKDHINIMEALALAGDMTIYGKRDDVKLIRTLPNGETKIITLDIRDTQIVSSPYFYLHQDDELYVVPNKARARTSDVSSQTSILISLGSILLTAVNIFISLSKK
ncbi:MAG: polysaccharide biosynthesis/export family protein [Prevotella sp.]|jgi:polysaccharide export outer membrane protein|nr:polysaccharide biosynthesis/export family protein [Prevotella sp.]